MPRRILTRPLAAVLALAATLALGATAASLACGSYASPHDLRSPNSALTAPTIAQFRAAGQRGLDALLAQYDRTHDPALIPAIDAVAQQHDARWSRLFWHTDLAAAQSAALAEHKPILALRMLGNLTDEYSCANSRFFRTALYANQNVSRIMRDNFVLLWTSERPVPVITIDYGDGRTLRRTVTGNSIHYILTPDGAVVDAVPGLYDPATFADILTRAAAAAPHPEALPQYRAAALADLSADWAALSGSPAPTYAALAPAAPAPRADIPMDRAMSKSGVERPLVNAALGKPAAPLARTEARAQARASAPGAPHALVAADRAIGKRMAEMPILTALELPVVPPIPDADSGLWASLAQRHPAMIDQRSIDLIRSQNPGAYTNPTALDLIVHNFQQSIALDTVRNNHLFRRQILAWLAQSPTSMDALNTRVYADLFLTPRSDPWLGLNPDSTYTALTSEGCSVH